MGNRFNDLQDSLIRAGATDFVETGAAYGHTSGVVAGRYGIPVWTCEPHPGHAAKARENLPPEVHFYEMKSAEFLPLVIPRLGSLPLFFLDAHGASAHDKGPPCPVLEELAAIRDGCRRAMILVHDIKVPRRGRGEFFYWRYEGFELTLRHIAPALNNRHIVFVPIYDPPRGEIVAGYALIFQDMEPVGDLENLIERKPECTNIADANTT